VIASIRGTLLERGEGFVVVEAAGVGYQVNVTTGTLVSLPAVGEEVRLHTRHVVREDAQLLFGFAERDELKLFDLLIAVNGVGPRIAIAVLSGLSPVRFAAAVRDENLGAITSVPGVGRKTAERLVVELRDKLGFLPAMPSGSPTAGERQEKKLRVLAKNERHEDAVAALITLGYTMAQATDAVSRVAEEVGEAAAEDLLKRALAKLARSSLVTR
jgi:Holliday junction DNA helicase RuvA